MAKRPDDDLFKESTMTFGEHLEELRLALFKGLIGFAVGVLVGLYVAEWVMDWVQQPLKSALEDYYLENAVIKLTATYKDEFADLEFAKKLTDFIKDNRVTFEDMYVEKSEGRRLAEEVGIAALLAPLPTPKPHEGEAENGSDKPQETPEPTEPETKTDENPATPAGKSVVERLKDIKLPPPNTEMVKVRVWKPINTEVKSLNAQEAFMIWLKAAFVSGVMFAAPWIFFQIWTFVAAGLYPHEKNYVYIYLPISILLFLAGAGLAFFFVFKPVLTFLFQFNRSMHIDPDPRISEWLGFVLLMPLGFGISFQLPLVMLFIHRIGIVSIQAYTEKWRLAILIIFVVSMVLTPADPVSMLLMAGPLCVLYFLGIAMCRWMPRQKNPFAEAYEP